MSVGPGIDVVLRPFRAADRPGTDLVCVRTADAGGDARGLYSTDELMPDIFSRPYLRREPELAQVIEADGRVVGYVLGTADTPGFVRWYRDVWLPALADRYPITPDVEREALLSPAERLMLSLHRTPERMLVAEVAHLPAHLHIDVLPEFQGCGWGRRLMTAFLTGLAARGVDGVHLCMATANTPARAFYDRLGFVEVSVADAAEKGVVYLRRSTRT